MMRIWNCARFTFARLWTVCLVYIAMYFVFSCGFPTLEAVAGHSVGNVSAGLWMLCCVFVLVTCMVLYTNLTNNLLLYGNTRWEIFSGIVLAMVLVSAASSLLSPAVDALAQAVAQAVGNHVYNPILFAYPNATLPMLMTLYFSLNIAVLGFALLYVSLAYKFGRKLHLFFWLGVVVIWNIVGALLYVDGQSNGMPLLAAYLGLGGHPGAAVWHLLATGAVLGAAAWLLARRQPLRA